MSDVPQKHADVLLSFENPEVFLARKKIGVFFCFLNNDITVRHLSPYTIIGRGHIIKQQGKIFGRDRASIVFQ